ncbi:MAG: GNAT family N-acetyltransferase [Ruminococcus sp.]|jgi:GNAT superfamily N-acetyltransferase|nr:GNAT family N-acetyltransferase [Ruminococcus sp.]
MIKHITDTDLMSIEALHKNYYGRKILSYYISYGTGYDFCRFFEVSSDDTVGYMVQFNALIVIFSQGELESEELAQFIAMNKPFRVEAPWIVLKNLCDIPGYGKLKRTMFEFTDHKPLKFDESKVIDEPSLDEIYNILEESFPTVADHGLWITEHSHKIRRGLSKIYLYNHCTTATVIFDVDDNVLVGQVATKPEARGKGYARDLLYWIGHTLSLEGKTVTLFALDYRESFYEEIGFKPVSVENVIQVLQ